MDYKIALSTLDIVYPDGIAKGFPLWTDKGLEIQNITTNLFLDIFSNSNTKVNYPKQIRTLEEFSNQYKNRIDKYDSSLPIFKDGDKLKLFITDNLPYNLKKIANENLNSLLTYYYVLRLLNSKQVPMSRDYYISPLLQFNVVIENCTEQEAIDLVNKKMKMFCDAINLPTIILEYKGVEKYSKKVYMVSALNNKMETQTILQCSLLSEELLKEFGNYEYFKDKFVFDIGYSQKIFAYLAHNNMDQYGMRLPSIYNQKDVVIIYNKKIKSKIIEDLKCDEEIKNKIYLDDRLGNTKLKTLKNYYLNKGVRIILVQNYLPREDKEFFLEYNAMQSFGKLFTFEEICDIIKTSSLKLDKFYYDKMNKKLDILRAVGCAYVSEFKEKGKIVK